MKSLQTFDDLIQGARLIFKPGFRRFLFIPLLINLFIFVLVTNALINAYQHTSAQILALLPSWLQWLNWLLAPLIGLIFLVVYGYCFNIITNFIAAPFFGKLAEKVEAYLTGEAPQDEPLWQLIPRTFKRELAKLWYFGSRGVVVVLIVLTLFFVPGVNIVGTLLGISWGAWCMALQYMDYAADNHQTDFYQLRQQLGKQRLRSCSFGGWVLLGNMIPLFNILVPPIAVAGATLFWVREYRPDKTQLTNNI